MRWFCLIRQVLMAAVGLSCLGTATLGLPDSSTELLKIFLNIGCFVRALPPSYPEWPHRANWMVQTTPRAVVWEVPISMAAADRV